METAPMMGKTASFVVCLLSATLAHGADNGPSRRWTPEAMIQVKQVGGVQVSPDGKQAAFVVRRAVMDGERSEFVPRIVIAGASGGNEFPLTWGEHSSEGPQWSPDGAQIAFLSRRSGKTQIWLIRVSGGEARRLTDARSDVLSFRWSPDGRQIAYVAADPLSDAREKKVREKDDARVIDEQVPQNRLYAITIDGGEKPRQGRTLTQGEFSIYADSSPGFDWSPDGKTIVFAHTPTPGSDDWTKSDLSVVNVATSAVTALVHSGRSESSPFFAPDGRSIAFAASDDPPTWAFDSSLYLIPSGGATPRKLADSFDHRPELLGWTAGGDRLIYRENRGTTTRLYALPLDGAPQPLGPEAGVVAEPSLNATRTALGFSYQTVDQPAEAFVVRLDRPDAIQVSHVHNDLPDLPLGRTEVVRWRSRDGREIEGLLTYPVGYQGGQRYPLLLVIHGGPAGVFTRSFIASPAVSTSGSRQSYSAYPLASLAANGYAILRCNVRGSSGYGKEFRHANRGDWGGGDFEDLMAGVDHVIAQGIADADRLGVMGWSYGGFMTTWVIGHTARFKAASVGAAVTDLISFPGTTDIASYLSSYWGGEPWDRPETYRAHSPITHIKGINTPTLIQHGADDERVPIGQGYELYNALKRQGCLVKMVVYPRTHHAIQEPKLLLDAMRRNLEWFGRYVPATSSEAAGASGAGP
jgi:dipeptidyl aminopeptidase/acylaminoacyl peptidase